MSEHIILIEKKDHVAYITLNRPDKRNAINKEMFDTIKFIFTDLNTDSNIWLIVIQGTESRGIRVFSSGVDYIELATKADNTVFEQNDFAVELQESFNAIEHVNKPVIALMEGYCLGAGLELVLACDIRIATEDCLIGFPETELGIIPDLGGTTRIVREIGIGNTKRLVLTADKVTGKEAFNMGLVNYVVPAEKAQQKLNEVINVMLKRSPLALNRGKKLINQVHHLDMDTALQVERLTQLELLQSEDVREAFVARMEKRDPNWKNK
jgi:enoyl-CoA hydratase/carnithine racemase